MAETFDMQMLKAIADCFPHLPLQEVAAVHETLRSYIRLAVEISDGRPEPLVVLTAKRNGGSVMPGQVEPRTFTNTG